MAGTMIQTGNSVAGNMGIVNTAVDCFSLFDTVTLSGSFSGNVLTFTSLPVNGEVMTLNLTSTGNGLGGTYTVSGGDASCNDAGTVTATGIPAITGLWTGDLLYMDGTRFGNAQFDLTQGPFTTNGYSPLSGTATLNLIDPNNPRSFLPPITCPISTSDSGNGISGFSGAGLVIYSCFKYQGWIVTDNAGNPITFEGPISSPTMHGNLVLSKAQ
jgi:hypothetical protein